MPGPAVVVVGSLHYDIILQAPHRPAKGETVTGSSWFPKFGGKGGNQALAAAGEGATVRMVGAVGQDGFADFLLDRLLAGGVATDRIQRQTGAGSGMSVATMDAGGDYGAVIVSGANVCIDAAVLETSALWDGTGMLILQNEIPEAVNVAAARAARAHAVPVCLNAAPMRAMPRDLLDLTDILIVNGIEAEQLCGIAVSDLVSACRAAETLSRQIQTVVVTAGGDGVALALRDGKAQAWPALDVALKSTHGAGDMFTGTFCAARAAGATDADAVQTANAAAARHVAKDATGG